MNSQQNGRRVLRFGDYEVDREARELRRSGQRVSLQIQPFAVLEMLVERAGEVVTREDLRARVWPATVYVDFDHGLNNAINRLRRALNDSAESPRYLETLPRVGYRFIHPIDSTASVPLPSPAGHGSGRWTLRVGAIAATVAAVVGLAVGAARWARHDTGRATVTTSGEAREAYLRGVELFEQRRKESTERSIEELRRAIDADPNFAAAHAALAMSYALAGGPTIARYRNPSEVVGPALAAAHRALQLDPNLAAGHVALANVLNQLMPWSEESDVVIESSYLRALELDAADANAHLFFGNFLSKRGRNREAVDHFRFALTADPLSPSANSRLGMELMAIGETDEGVELLRKTVELDPFQFNAQVRLGWAYLELADLDAAEVAFEDAERISPDSAKSKGGLAVVAARRGDSVTAHTLLQTVLSAADVSGDAFEVAMVYVALRDADRSIEWLARTARTSRTLHMAGQWGIRSRIYDWLRGDPRFDELEREIAATVQPGNETVNAPTADAIRG
jgi:DNA-binding winged helix-turn-helix (wHTH) protein/Tfp pilus assembly protein PilF